MPISCDPNDLATAATCFSELSWRQRHQIRVYLLCTIVNGDTPVNCTPDALAAAAACYAKLSSGQLDQIETYLFCQLAGGGPPPSVDTIYTANGTVTGTRTVNVGTNVLSFTNYSRFNVDSDPTYVAANFSYFEAQLDSVLIGCAVPSFTTYAELLADPKSWTIQTKGSSTAHLTVHGDTGVTVGNTGEKVGFLGSSPVARIASADQAVATDPASTMALANALRAALIPTTGFGLIKGSA